MRTARYTASGSAALITMAWPSSIPSVSVSLRMRLFSCGWSARRIRSALQSRQLSPPSVECMAPFTSSVAYSSPALAGVGGEAHHPAGEVHPHPLRQGGIGQAGEMRAAVGAAVDAHRGGAGIDGARIMRVDQDRPHLHAAVGKAQPFPVRAAVGADVGAGLAAEEDRVGLGRVRGDRVHVGFGEDVVPRPARFAAEQPAGAAVPGGGGAGQQDRFLGHGSLLCSLGAG